MQGVTTTDVDAPLVVVSSDCHIGPGCEQLRPYCPPELRDDFEGFAARVGKIVEAFDEARRLFDAVPAMVTLNKNLETEGHHDPAARARDLDFDGVAAEVIFHGSENHEPIPFVEPRLSSGTSTRERELAAAGMHIYNQWLADFCSHEPARHVGVAHLPLWDIEAAIAEAEWAAGAGLRSVNLPAEAGPDSGRGFRGDVPYQDPAWEPFWSACEDLGLPLSCHGGAGTPGDGVVGRAIWLSEQMAQNLKPMSRLVLSGVFERHPRLVLVLTENPGRWWRSTVEDLDSLYWNRFIGSLDQLSMPPSGYCARNIYVGASFHSPLEAADAVEHGYSDRVLWGSDYPHTEGTWQWPDDWDDTPVTRLALRHTYAGLPADDVRAMVGENAVRAYGLDGDALLGVAARIGAPTVAELSVPIDAVPDNPGMWAFRREGTWH